MHTRTTRRQFRLQRQTFSIWRPCWRPYWISRLVIIYVNLCRQFQKLQTIGNILVYDTFCCTGGGGGGEGGGSGLPLERVASFTHCQTTERIIGHYVYKMHQRGADDTMRVRKVHLQLCISRMLEDTFSLGPAQISSFDEQADMVIPLCI